MKEKIKQLNEIKRVYLITGPFKKKVFTNALKEIGLKMVDFIFAEMLKQEILVKISKNQYFFKDDKPIYIGALEKIIMNVRKEKAASVREYYHRHKNNKTKEVETDDISVAEIIDVESEIRRAIALLKQNGYKVYKCVTTYEEI